MTIVATDRFVTAYRAGAVVWTFGIFLTTLIPGSHVPRLAFELSVDKLIHWLLFFGYTWLWIGALRGTRRAFVLAFVTGSVLGVMTEVLQGSLNIQRSFDWMDALADLIGVASGIVIARVTHPMRTKPSASDTILK